MNKFANIAFNLPVDSLFTYSIPASLKYEIKTGSRVLAPLGKRNITGIVVEFPDKPNIKKLKPLVKALDPEPLISQEMIDFGRWISKYYICPLGEVLFSAIPKGIAVESKLLYSLKDNTPTENLSGNQKTITDLLQSGPLTIKQLEHRLKSNNVRGTVGALLSKGILSSEMVTQKEKVKPKFEKYVVFNLRDDFSDFTGDMLDIFMKENNIKSTCQHKLMKHLVGGNISE